ncbi:MAG: efflux RND transporter periplasmic adaptor subunit [Pseudomonadota bacterium]|nr:efflux RND transporter periplasmic adaptor subunit [Pseudomonadota bacterium]
MTLRAQDVVLLLSLSLTGLLAACGDPSQAQPPPPGPPQISVAPAVLRAVHDSEEFSGRLEAPESVDVRGRIGGTIDKVAFRDGALVKAGELLFAIDPRPYQSEVARDQAQLEAARAQLGVAQAQATTAQAQSELARADLARADKLLAAHAVSRQEYDQLSAGARTSDSAVRAAQAGVSSAEAAVRSAEAALRTAQLNLDYTSVRAPISGRISRANVTAGNLIDDKTVLTTIVVTNRVFAYFDGSEATFLRIRGLSPQQLTVRMGLADENGLPHTGKLDFIDNRLNAQTGAIRMRAVFDNAKGEFAPGLFARIELTAATARNLVMTPDRAIGTDQNKKFVFVMGANNAAEQREVQPGPLVGAMRAIESGLKAGDLVVIDGLQRVHPGLPLSPQKLELDDQGMPLPAAAPAAPAASKS